MADYMDLVRRDYVAEEGNVSAIMGEVIQLRRPDGTQVSFKAGMATNSIAVGNDVCVIAVRGVDKAVMVLDRTTGLKHRVQIIRGNTGVGFQKAGKAAAWFTFVILLVPVIGQLTAIGGFVGAVVGGLVGRQIKGSPPVSIMTMVTGFVLYMIGTVMLYGHALVGGSAILGFAVMVVGDVFFTFMTRRGRDAFAQAMESFIEEHRQPKSA